MSEFDYSIEFRFLLELCRASSNNKQHDILMRIYHNHKEGNLVSLCRQSREGRKGFGVDIFSKDIDDLVERKILLRKDERGWEIYSLNPQYDEWVFKE